MNLCTVCRPFPSLLQISTYATLELSYIKYISYVDSCCETGGKKAYISTVDVNLLDADRSHCFKWYIWSPKDREALSVRVYLFYNQYSNCKMKTTESTQEVSGRPSDET